MSVHPIALILGILVGLLIGLTVWGFWRVRKDQAGDSLMGRQNDLIVGFLVLAGFALGVLLTYLLGVVL